MRHIVTLTGPSGIGKSYIKRKAKKKFLLKEPPIYTTRPIRDEEESSERITIREEEFEVLEKNQEFLFVNNLFGYRYGLKSKDIYESHEDLILELYVDNTKIFRKLIPDAYMIAMIPSSINFLEKRLRKRGDDARTISKRLKHATKEVKKIIEIYEEGIFDLLYVIDETNERNAEFDILNYIKKYLALYRK